VKALTPAGGAAFERMCIEPIIVVYIPVMIAEREGAQTGAVAKALV